MVIIGGRPACHGPAVVQLPHERTHAVRHVPAVCLYGAAHGFGLQHLAHVEELLEIFGNIVVPAHILLNAEVADTAALVGCHDFRFDVVVLRQGVFFYRIELREGLEAVFTDETPDVVFILLETVFLVPYAPIVVVAAGCRQKLVGVYGSVRHGGRGPVVVAVGVGGDDLREQMVEQVGVCLENPGFFGFGVPLLPAPACPCRVDFVVAAPQRQTGVVAQAHHIVDSLLADIFQKFAVSRIHGAGKGEILPDHDTVPVAQVVKMVVFIDAAAPHANHVHVGVGGVLHHLLVILRRDAGQEHVVGYHVGAFGKYGHAVQFKVEGGTRLVFFPDEL